MTPFPSQHQKKAPSGEACQSCILGCGSDGSRYGLGFMQPDGLMRTGVMIVAEALGHHEAIQEKALVGPSGFLLGKAMSRLNYTRDDFRYANTIFCEPQPTHDLYHPSGSLHAWAKIAIHHCPYLDAEIRAQQPKAILALGETAFTALTGVELPMMSARGYVFEALKHPGVMVVPTFHPAFILRGNAALTQTLIWDLEKAIKVAKGWPGYEAITALMDPSLHEWDAYVAEAIAAIDAGVPLGTDVETPYKQKRGDDEDEVDATEDITYNIDRVSFCFEESRGASVAWAMPWLVGIKRLLTHAAAKGMTLIWNRPYDRPRLVKATGVALPIERTRDSMDLFHVLFNALPRKLGFATACLPHAWRFRAWKHLSKSDPQLYSVMDAVALWRNDRDCLRLLSETGQLDVYNLICRDLDPVLEKMSLAGMGVDSAKKSLLESDLQRILTDTKGQMTKLVPEAILRRQRWKGEAAARAAVELMKARGDVLPDVELAAVPATRKAKLCVLCGTEGAAHTKRKTVKETVAEATEESPCSDTLCVTAAAGPHANTSIPTAPTTELPRSTL